MKIILNEKQEETLKNKLLDEAINYGFSIERMRQMRTFKERRRYCEEYLGEPIGKGSSRIVFQYDDNWVLKLAFNSKGVAQNEVEYSTSKDIYYDLSPKVNENLSDCEGFEFLVSEYVIPATDNDFKKVFGFDFETFKRFILGCVNMYDSRSVRYNAKMSEEEILDIRDKNEMANEYYNYLVNFEPFYYDMLLLKNYGLSNRNGYIEILLCDSGYNEEVYKKFYRRIKENVERTSKLDEGIKIHKGERGKRESTQGKWEDSIDCPHCGESKAFFSMSISDGNKGRGRIKVIDENGIEKDSEVQTIALYYCPKCYRFTALNNMA